MKTSSHNAQHCLSSVAITRHDAGMIWSGFMGYGSVKNGPVIALANRMLEVRG